MSLLEKIIARGNRPPLRPPYRETGIGNKIKCADGFRLSVIAGGGTYCSPRPSAFPGLGQVDQDYPGPYVAVEVGFPSERPEPWDCPHDRPEDCNRAGDAWACYAKDSDAPTETIYPYVPVAMVRALVEAHGGEA